MKMETTANKLAALLGLTDKVAVPEHFKDKTKPKSKSKKNQLYTAVDETEIQSFRAAQGLIYFLQAPQLFESKVCKHCSESFLVSRKFVGYCSYTCIELSLNEMGIQWNKRIKNAATNDDQFEPMVNDPEIWNGNEPIWIKNLDEIQKVLDAAQRLSSTESLSPSTL